MVILQIFQLKIYLAHSKPTFNYNQGEVHIMGEMFNAAILSFSLILVGLSVGFLLLKLQGGEE